MSNPNAVLYFVSQSYRQVQLSVEKGTEPYAYSDFSKQFYQLLEASGNEAYTRNLTIMLVEEAARLKQTTDYLCQEMAFEARASATGDRTKAIATNRGKENELASQRMSRKID